MFTQAQLVSFGNFLLSTYGVKFYSTDGRNIPLGERQVQDVDLFNWKETQIDNGIQLPSKFQVGDRATFFAMPDDDSLTSFPGIPAEILAVHFYEGKVKYDLDLLFVEGMRSRIYNVDSVLVTQERVDFIPE